MRQRKRLPNFKRSDLLRMCNAVSIPLPSVNPFNRVTSPLLAALHHGREQLLESATMSEIETRFWKYVNKDGPTPAHRPELGPCWVWTGGKGRRGRGSFRVDGKQTGAPRISLLIHGTQIPRDRKACHHCDNPSCVRPDHLFVGTQSDNMQDCSSKGRLNHWNAAKTHCKRGHALTPDNVYTAYDAKNRPRRDCRKCRNLRRGHLKQITEAK